MKNLNNSENSEQLDLNWIDDETGFEVVDLQMVNKYESVGAEPYLLIGDIVLAEVSKTTDDCEERFWESDSF